jgi:hypothetical protein
VLINRVVIAVVGLVLVFAQGGGEVQAQTRERKLEVGLHYSTINLSPFDSRESGGGVRLSYNINEYLAVEAEGNLFEFAIGDGPPTDEVLGAQGVLGVKAGWRNRRVGVFAKVRPGVSNFPTLRVPRHLCILSVACDGSGRSGNRFSVDTGAVVEVYPTEKIILRFDIGDTAIRFRDDFFFKSAALERINDGFSHNFQLSVGVGFRF